MSNKLQIVADHALASCMCGVNLRGPAIDLGYGKEGRGRYAQYCQCGEMARYDLKRAGELLDDPDLREEARQQARPDPRCRPAYSKDIMTGPQPEVGSDDD
jgi:hypothetical protein